MSNRRTKFAGLVLVASVSTLLAPQPARADVLVSYPGKSVCVSKTIKLGVWYQSYSGGPRTFRVKVVDPAGNIVLQKSGRATTTWRYWRYRPQRTGVHKVVYSSAGWRAPYKVDVNDC